jgi:hypothetical protein
MASHTSSDSNDELDDKIAEVYDTSMTPIKTEMTDDTLLPAVTKKKYLSVTKESIVMQVKSSL